MMKIAHVLALAVTLAACSSAPDSGSNNSGGGGATLGTLQAASPGNSAVAPGSAQDLQQNVGDRIYFETDQSDISAEGRRTLERQAEWLRRYPNVTVTIEGHCDERGTREYNLALGERRANAARQVLVALGIAPTRITTITYGKERPAVVGSIESAWAQNRRAVTIVN